MITLTCLMYGAGLPLMFVILALKCLSQYVIDRWMLLRVCRVPPRISDRVTKTVTRLLVFGLFLYLTMAAWMLSFFVTPDIGSVAQRNLSASAPSTPTSFTTEDSDFASNEGSYSADRVIQANVFFIFLAMILMFFYYILVKRFFYPVIVTFAIRGVLGTLMQSLTCCCRKRVALWAKSDQMDFYDAYRDGKILGTPTYAIIDQPEFKAHFEVDVKLHEPDDDLPDNAAAVQAEELKREKKRGMIAALMGRGEASDREDGGDDDDGQDGDEGDVEEDDAEGEEDGEGRETGTKQEPASGWGIGWLFGSR